MGVRRLCDLSMFLNLLVLGGSYWRRGKGGEEEEVKEGEEERVEGKGRDGWRGWSSQVGSGRVGWVGSGRSNGTSRHVTPIYVASRCVTLSYVSLRCVALRHVTSNPISLKMHLS